ncbi:MAG: bacteriophage Gp15 family protein [Clostridium sp.]|uniref:bacteriophage Gp15 family protein n=1 Tax=Clostridium sp. TaxID=1506 RepID=UPI002A8A7E5E|nr:bacteriophage Gp15 family protein [Clostridium sp.]MDY5098504.1 bacteriophage Gp15 family protein [Clostridium sp.]
MNILIDTVPTSVDIDGVEYEINSNFRYGILFELLMQDSTIEEKDKIYMALDLYYPVIPTNIDEAIEKILWFYKCGKDEAKVKSTGKDRGTTQIYSFEYDDDYIYSAFLDQYRVDLQDIKYLHWWKFKAMFKSLKEDNMIVKIMGYRSIDLSKIKDKEQKDYYKKMQKLYEIPVSKNEKEKLDEINNILLNGGDISKVL